MPYTNTATRQAQSVLDGDAIDLHIRTLTLRWDRSSFRRASVCDYLVDTSYKMFEAEHKRRRRKYLRKTRKAIATNAAVKPAQKDENDPWEVNTDSSEEDYNEGDDDLDEGSESED